MRFYEREGYTLIPNFGYYADSALSICYEKKLAPARSLSVAAGDRP